MDTNQFMNPKLSVMWKSVVSDSLWLSGLYSSWNSPGQNTGMASLSLLQEDLPNPGIKPRSSTLQADSLPVEPQGKPKSCLNIPKSEFWINCNFSNYNHIWSQDNRDLLKVHSALVVTLQEHYTLFFFSLVFWVIQGNILSILFF